MKSLCPLLLLLVACRNVPTTIKVTEFTGDKNAWHNMDSLLPWPDSNAPGYKPEDTIEPFVRRCCHMRDHPLGWRAPYQVARNGKQVVLIVYNDTIIDTRLDSMTYYDHLMNKKIK